jgi:hypothetical protein
MYQAKLGYDRAELAIVPSNRASVVTPGMRQLAREL